MKWFPPENDPYDTDNFFGGYGFFWTTFLKWVLIILVVFAVGRVLYEAEIPLIPYDNP